VDSRGHGHSPEKRKLNPSHIIGQPGVLTSAKLVHSSTDPVDGVEGLPEVVG
jgi:hypothetical protein